MELGSQVLAVVYRAFYRDFFQATLENLLFESNEVPSLYVPKRTYCLRDCDESSECAFSEEFDQYVCVCKTGFKGNHISGCYDIDELRDFENLSTKQCI